MGGLHANAIFTTTINALAKNSLAIPFCTMLLFVPNLYFIIVIVFPPTIFLSHHLHIANFIIIPNISRTTIKMANISCL
jgi:hypothetical protein